jgi:hypothetical protein
MEDLEIHQAKFSICRQSIVGFPLEMIILFISENMPDLPSLPGEQVEWHTDSVFPGRLNLICDVHFVGFDRQ